MNKTLKESLVFVVSVIGLSFLVFWGPLALLNVQAANLVEGTIQNPFVFALFVLGGFAPSTLGLLLVRLYDGKKGLQAMLHSAVSLRLGRRAYFAISLSIFSMALFHFCLIALTGGTIPYYQFVLQLPTILPLIILGPLSEEFGWRGFLQSRLNRIYPPVFSALIVGLVWALWHLPLFHIPGTTQHEFNIPFSPFVMSLMAMSVVYNYAFIKSGGKVSSAVLLHWLSTYLLQVVYTSIDRNPLYDRLEFLPALLVGLFFLLLFKRQGKKTPITFSGA